MIIPISQDINKFFVNINGTSYPVKKMLFNGQGVQNVEVYADYYSQYFTIESLEDNNVITFTIHEKVPTSLVTSVSYSTNSGLSWTTIANEDDVQKVITVTLNTGEKVLFKGVANAYFTYYYISAVRYDAASRFSSTKKINAYGNIMSLLYEDNFEGQTTLTTSYTFRDIFNYCSNLIEAKNLKLPATTLTNACYFSMFNSCYKLVSIPELPATTLAADCYWYMFQNCTSLVDAPVLPAIEIKSGCYYGMFRGCTSLVNAPVLPATTMHQFCYGNMFQNCTSLVNAPVLPATTLANDCYWYMFSGCTSLTEAPDLPAQTLTVRCYAHMFEGCTSLRKIVCLATDISATNCTTDWVKNVASYGTFYKDSSMSWGYGTSGIPTGWTVVDW